MDEGFLEFGAVGEFGHFGAVFAEDAKLVAPFVVAEVILVAAFAPFGEMVGFEVFGVVAEVFDDLWVGAAVVDPLVDFVANGLGELGDFAVAFVARRYPENGGNGGVSGNDGSGFSSVGSIHIWHRFWIFD